MTPCPYCTSGDTVGPYTGSFRRRFHRCLACGKTWEAQPIPSPKPSHTSHCSARMRWGDGECECGGDGKGSPHHTMNPPPGGWTPSSKVPVPLSPGQAIRKLRKLTELTLGDAAAALGITVVQLSALERDVAVLSPNDNYERRTP